MQIKTIELSDEQALKLETAISESWQLFRDLAPKFKHQRQPSNFYYPTQSLFKKKYRLHHWLSVHAFI